jgi:hypothetical protein
MMSLSLQISRQGPSSAFKIGTNVMPVDHRNSESISGWATIRTGPFHRNVLNTLEAWFQFTVSENVVECVSDPEVAVMVSVEVTGAGADDPPPHPLSRLKPATLIASSNRICARRRFFHPRQHSAIANVVPGRFGLGLW